MPGTDVGTEPHSALYISSRRVYMVHGPERWQRSTMMTTTCACAQGYQGGILRGQERKESLILPWGSWKGVDIFFLRDHRAGKPGSVEAVIFGLCLYGWVGISQVDMALCRWNSVSEGPEKLWRFEGPHKVYFHMSYAYKKEHSSLNSMIVWYLLFVLLLDSCTLKLWILFYVFKNIC